MNATAGIQKMAVATAPITVWLRVHRHGRPGHWFRDTFASQDKMTATLADFKKTYLDVQHIEVRYSAPD